MQTSHKTVVVTTGVKYRVEHTDPQLQQVRAGLETMTFIQDTSECRVFDWPNDSAIVRNKASALHRQSGRCRARCGRTLFMRRKNSEKAGATQKETARKEHIFLLSSNSYAVGKKLEINVFKFSLLEASVGIPANSYTRCAYSIQ